MRKKKYKSGEEMQRLNQAFRRIQQENIVEVLTNKEDEIKEIKEEDLKEYKDYKEYIENTDVLPEEVRESALKESYTKLKRLAEIYEHNNWAFTRNCLIVAGKAAESLGLNGQGGLEWTLASHDTRREAYDLSASFDYKKDYFILSFAANSSQRLFETSGSLDEKLRWGETCFEERRLVAEKAEEDNNSKYAGYVLSFAGNVAEELSDLFEYRYAKIEWLKKSYDSRIKASLDSELGEDFAHASHVYTFAANIARDIAGLVESDEERSPWYQKAFEAQSRAGNLSRKINPSHATHCFSFAGGLARQIMDLSHDPKDKMQWGNRAYEHFLLSIETAEGINRKHWIVQIAHAGDMAEILFDLNNVNTQKQIFW